MGRSSRDFVCTLATDLARCTHDFNRNAWVYCKDIMINHLPSSMGSLITREWLRLKVMDTGGPIRGPNGLPEYGRTSSAGTLFTSLNMTKKNKVSWLLVSPLGRPKKSWWKTIVPSPPWSTICDSVLLVSRPISFYYVNILPFSSSSWLPSAKSSGLCAAWNFLSLPSKSQRSWIVECPSRPELCDSATYRWNRFSLPVGGVVEYPLILLELFVLVSDNLSQCLCLTCLPTFFVDAPILIWQPFDLTSVVSSVSFNLLEPSVRSGIMIGRSNSVFDLSVLPLELSTILLLAHTVHSPSSDTLCTLGVSSRCTDHSHCNCALTGVLTDFHGLSRHPRQLHRPSSLVSHPAWSFHRCWQLPMVTRPFC